MATENDGKTDTGSPSFCEIMQKFSINDSKTCISFSIVFCCHSLRLEIIKLWKNWYRISIVLMKKDINWLILWEKVSRLGGANRKGFNRGFRQNDGDSVSVFPSFYVFVSFMLNFCIFLHNFTKRWRSCIGFSIVLCFGVIYAEILHISE